MILNDEERLEYSVRPADAEDVIFTVDGDTVTIEFDLVENSDYIVVIQDIKDTNGNLLEDSLSYKFTSTYSPLYATPKQIINDVAKAIDILDIDKVLYAIRSNSMDVQYMVSDTGIDWTNPPYPVKQYVRYQTDLALLVGRYSEATINSTEQKSLGDFSVTSGGSTSTAFKIILDEIKRRAEYWLKRLGSNTKSKPTSFVKGGEDWPSHLTRSW